MKIDPINLITNYKSQENIIFYFITGNEFTLMEGVKNKIIKNLSDQYTLGISRIKDLNSFNNNLGLFNDKTLYLISNTTEINDSLLDKLSISGNHFVFSYENSPKNKVLKNYFIKRSDSYVLECYELTKNDKIKILNTWINDSKLELDDSLYWFLIDKLSNKYVFLEKEFEKIKNLNSNSFNIDSIKRILPNNSSEVNKVFFEVLGKSSDLVSIFNESIKNKNDVSEFYYIFKQYCFLIINSENEDEFNKNIPRYLFRQKGFFLSLFRKYNTDKKKRLVNLLYKTEMAFRKNSSFSSLIALRFLMNFKKLTIS